MYVLENPLGQQQQNEPRQAQHPITRAFHTLSPRASPVMPAVMFTAHSATKPSSVLPSSRTARRKGALKMRIRAMRKKAASKAARIF